jgi:hypothetical protein
MTHARKPYMAIAAITVTATMLISCATSNPYASRVLLSITVTPETADAAIYPNGQVTFTATGTFSLSPSPAPIPAAAPYSGEILVSNPTNPAATIATVISTGNGTAVIQCSPGASGTVPIVASASANNGTAVEITGSANLTCP